MATIPKTYQDAIFQGYEDADWTYQRGYVSRKTVYFGIMLGSARYFFSLGKTVQDNMVSLKRLEEVKSHEQSPIGAIHLNHIEDISIKNYSKSYGENNIISNFE